MHPTAQEIPPPCTGAVPGYRPTFLMLMSWHQVTTPMLWRASGFRLQPLWIEALKANIPMPAYLIEAILRTFNQITGEHYQVSDLREPERERKLV